MPYAVISPVGISLFRRTYGSSFQDRTQQLAGRRVSDPLMNTSLQELKQRLQVDEEEGRIEESCAEIKSVLALERHRGNQPPTLLILLPTATPESLLCSRAVEYYFEKSHGIASLTSPIEGMDSNNPAVFQRVGIRMFLNQLNRAIDHCKQHGLDPVFNATPGYKAETSLALLLAQFVGASVFYIHEMMRAQIILLPSIPLTIREEYWNKWGDLVLAVGRLAEDPNHPVGAMEARQFNALTDYRIRQFSEAEILFEDIDLEDDKPPSKTLSAIGQLLYEAYKTTSQEQLASCQDSRESKIRWPSAEHHWPRGFESWMAQIAGLSFVREVRPKEFNGARASGVSNAFQANNPGLVICTHFGGDYGAEVRVLTTAKDRAQWTIARRRIEALFTSYAEIPSPETTALTAGVLDTYGSLEGIAAANKTLRTELTQLESSIGQRLDAQRKRLQKKLDALQQKLRQKEAALERRRRKAGSDPPDPSDSPGEPEST